MKRIKIACLPEIQSTLEICARTKGYLGRYWPQLPITPHASASSLSRFFLRTHPVQDLLLTTASLSRNFNIRMSNYTTILWRRQRWGFVIYRTDYSSKADWTKFLAMFKTWALHGFPGPQLENGRLARSCQHHY